MSKSRAEFEAWHKENISRLYPEWLDRADEFADGDRLTYCEKQTRQLYAAWQASRKVALHEGYQIVPIKISEAMYAAYHKVDDAAWCAGSDNGANMSEIWDAMLEAARSETCK
jgi:hypothetical protein